MQPQAVRIKRELTEFVEQRVSKIAVRLTFSLWLDNPEDTGFSEVNWIPQIGSMFEGTAGTYEQAEEGNLNRSYQLNGADLVSSSYRLKDGVVNVTNNVDYIIDLNEGSSAQAPAGFVQRAMDKVVTQLAREA